MFFRNEIWTGRFANQTKTVEHLQEKRSLARRGGAQSLSDAHQDLQWHVLTGKTRGVDFELRFSAFRRYINVGESNQDGGCHHG